MIQRILSTAVLGAAFIGVTGCSSNSEFKKEHGVEYKIVKDAPGKTAQIGDVVEVNIVAMTDTGKKGSPPNILGDSHKEGHPVPMLADTPAFRGDYKAVLTKLSVGDSVVVRVSCDTIMKAFPTQQQMPPWMKKGNFITFQMSIASIKSKAEYETEAKAKQAEMQKEAEQKAMAQLPIDDKMLQEYFAKNNIKATKTASGLYYTISKEGSGATAKAGQMVTMNYIGKTLEGKQFDANVDENSKPVNGRKPFDFVLGQGQVIKGWDEGVQLLKKGSKATFYIPSSLAYGTQSPSPDIAPNSILMFNVEVLDIKAAPQNPQGQQAPPQQ